MNERAIIEYFGQLCDRHNVRRPREIRINNRLTRALGRVQYENSFRGIVPLTVHFSKLMLTSDVAFAEDIIKHEFAHYYLLCQGVDDGHGKLFKSFCAEIGCKNDGTVAKFGAEADVPQQFKYEVYCTNCAKRVATYSRRCATLDRVKMGLAKSGCCKADCRVEQNW